MSNREALERIKRSHYVAMAMLCDGKPDEETENAIKVIEQALDRLEMLEKDIITTYEFNKKLREENAKLKGIIKRL